MPPTTTLAASPRAARISWSAAARSRWRSSAPPSKPSNPVATVDQLLALLAVTALVGGAGGVAVAAGQVLHGVAPALGAGGAVAFADVGEVDVAVVVVPAAGG